MQSSFVHIFVEQLFFQGIYKKISESPKLNFTVANRLKKPNEHQIECWTRYMSITSRWSFLAILSITVLYPLCTIFQLFKFKVEIGFEVWLDQICSVWNTYSKYRKLTHIHWEISGDDIFIFPKNFVINKKCFYCQVL